MPAITFSGVSKHFGDVQVIKEFTAEVPDREFLVLLGPSGCGKSTMLRMIAGLIDISKGELRFDGRRVNGLEPKARDVAFVFQSYALYPHMTVRANIAFPLLMKQFRWWQHLPGVGRFARRRAMRSSGIASRVAAIADMMELTPYLDRRPRTLSGGQRQRVALARALVREPSLFLLDEPLSNLDAKLRAQMRAEICALYRRVEASFIYVTHDQVEAMTMGTRIILLDGGVVQQHGTPREIYDRPANTFVARFIGSPAMNLFPAGEVPSTVTANAEVPQGVAQRGGNVLLGVRAERIAVSQDGHGLAATVVAVEHLGAETVVGFRLQPGSGGVYHGKAPGHLDLDVGAPCRVALDLTQASWFDPDTGARIETEMREPTR